MPTNALQPFAPPKGAEYSIEQVARLTHSSRHTIAVYYKHGLVALRTDPRSEGWWFDGEAVGAVRCIEHFRATYGMNLDAIGVLLELLQQLDPLRQEVQSREHGHDRWP